MSYSAGSLDQSNIHRIHFIKPFIPMRAAEDLTSILLDLVRLRRYNGAAGLFWTVATVGGNSFKEHHPSGSSCMVLDNTEYPHLSRWRIFRPLERIVNRCYRKLWRRRAELADHLPKTTSTIRRIQFLRKRLFLCFIQEVSERSEFDYQTGTDVAWL